MNVRRASVLWLESCVTSKSTSILLSTLCSFHLSHRNTSFDGSPTEHSPICVPFFALLYSLSRSTHMRVRITSSLIPSGHPYLTHIVWLHILVATFPSLPRLSVTSNDHSLAANPLLTIIKGFRGCCLTHHQHHYRYSNA